MIKLFGANVLSETQTNNLALSLGISSVSARYIHFVDAEKLTNQENEKLQQLLDYGEEFRGKETSNSVIIIPRLGTISYCSSKANEIAQNTGIDKIRRIERGVI